MLMTLRDMPPAGRILLVTAAVCLLFSLVAAAPLPDAFCIGPFSKSKPSQELPDGWERMSFGKIDTKTSYALVRDDSSVVLRAASKGGASGVARKRRVDPSQYPVLEWRWRVSEASTVLEKGDARTKAGDDFAARVFVTFDYDHGFTGRLKRRALKALGYEDVPSRALNYVWANRADVGTVFPNANTDWVMMMPLQSGAERTGEWVVERRNVAEDYRRAFGEDPPPITGVAIMTDTDDTDSKAIAYYGDVTFRRSMPDDGDGSVATAK